MNIKIEAENFAYIKHKGQKYDIFPYTFHLNQTVENLEKFGFKDDINLIIGGILHDVLEDTPTKIEELLEKFGKDISDLVWSVTGVGKNRKERFQSVIPKIKSNQRALALKLADRISNVEYSLNNPKMLKMYSDEYKDFCVELKNITKNTDSRIINMWNFLDDLIRTSIIY